MRDIKQIPIYCLEDVVYVALTKTMDDTIRMTNLLSNYLVRVDSLSDEEYIYQKKRIHAIVHKYIYSSINDYIVIFTKKFYFCSAYNIPFKIDCERVSLDEAIESVKKNIDDTVLEILRRD